MASNEADPLLDLREYSLLDALRQRRARRFACGMEHDRGPLAYASTRAPFPLSEQEIAALAFAACGVTGHALAELVYHPGGGGTMMGGLLGRTVSSADAVQAVSVVVTNDEGTYLLKRPQDFAYCEYIYQTYGRFPAYPAAFRTSVGFQAAHLDLAFYDRFYRPEALGEPQREHMQRWHGSAGQHEG